KKFRPCWRCAFVLSPQAVDLPEKNACAYDESMTGQTIYAYVGGNPVSRIDSAGLQYGRVAPRGPVLLGLGGYTAAGYPVDPSSMQQNAQPAQFWNDISNVPNRAPDLPGAYVGINFPWDGTGIQSYCADGYYGSSPIPIDPDNDPSHPKQCRAKASGPIKQAPQMSVSAPGMSRPFTCTSWKFMPE
ncbi:hypothetical protein, partial [Telluria antibiotica]|uniref:hypothetical protein n=1 Tax=Telluria antibiotica TaxID=2717319 RepID=UPI001AAE884C